MKITEIKTFKMQGGGRNWLFVKVMTDEGVHGWGEATLERHERAVEESVHVLEKALVGRDPTEIERNWQIMYRHFFWRAGVILGSAISGIDQALWDVTGKIYNQPVYKLLGGQVRDRVRAYGHWEDLRPDPALQDPTAGLLPISAADGRWARVHSERRMSWRRFARRSGTCAKSLALTARS